MPQRPFHCFAYLRNGAWEAICLDLDITVHAETLEDARSLLNGAVGSYIVAARSERPAVAATLVRRKAPLVVRLRCLARYLRAALLKPHTVPSANAEFVLYAPS